MKTAFLGKALMAAALGATTLTATMTPALADPGHGKAYGHDKDRGRDHDRDRDRHGDRHRDRDAYYRHPGPVIHVYDWNRPDPRYHGYYANRYYRGGYRPIIVTRETRIYHGSDGRYYCRRSDGTTGLIVGAALGGVIGNRLARGDSATFGTILGAASGALIGRELDRGSLVCR